MGYIGEVKAGRNKFQIKNDLGIGFVLYRGVSSFLRLGLPFKLEINNFDLNISYNSNQNYDLYFKAYRDLLDYNNNYALFGIKYTHPKGVELKTKLDLNGKISACSKFIENRKNTVQICVEKNVLDKKSKFRWGMKFDLDI